MPVGVERIGGASRFGPATRAEADRRVKGPTRIAGAQTRRRIGSAVVEGLKEEASHHDQ